MIDLQNLIEKLEERRDDAPPYNPWRGNRVDIAWAFLKGVVRDVCPRGAEFYRVRSGRYYVVGGPETLPGADTRYGRVTLKPRGERVIELVLHEPGVDPDQAVVFYIEF